jgi:hypothetical protein
LAGCRTTVTIKLVAVVAAFAGFKRPVATYRGWRFNHTRSRATVAVAGIAVVAAFAAFANTVAAHWTRRFDGATRRAAIAAGDVTVVAALANVELSITAKGAALRIVAKLTGCSLQRCGRRKEPS